jgi:hypothetical protein
MRITLDNWVQIATSLAVLIGLALVIVEMRQTHTLSRAEIGAGSFDLLSSRLLSTVGESFAVARAKSCIAPEDLSDSELIELREYYQASVTLINRQMMMRLIGGFNYRWQDSAETELGGMLETQQGRAWFETYKEDLKASNAELVAIGEDILSKLTINCAKKATEYFNKARSVTDL